MNKINHVSPDILERFELFDSAMIYDNKSSDRTDMKEWWRDWQQNRYTRKYSFPCMVAERYMRMHLRGYIITIHPGYKESKGHMIYRKMVDQISREYRFYPNNKHLIDHVRIGAIGSDCLAVVDGVRQFVRFEKNLTEKIFVDIANRINLITDIEKDARYKI